MKTIFKSVMAVLLLSGTTVNAQVPLLNSLPSAQAVIFLDFDGHVVTGTSWNYNGPIACSPSGLNNTQITTIFNRVAEDYRPFNVNITTDSTKFIAAPANRRMRVITTTTSSWYGSAGGVAFVGSFTWGDDTPCFVFSALLSYNVKNIAEANAHEAGHTLNLQHQSVYNASCAKTAEYNTGTGAGEIGWAPIMGAGYWQNLTLWNSGKSSVHCDSVQNDLDVITTSNGFGFRTDEHPGSFGTASNVNFVSNQFAVTGIITESTDQDIIKFTQPALGRFQLSAVPYNVGSGNAGSNLDLQVTLFNASQNQLNIYNPGTLLSSVIDTQLTAGVYYLKVEGRGNIYAPNYASLGSYSLEGNFSVSTLPLKKLELTGAVVGDQHRLSWIIEADETVTEQVLEVSADGNNFVPLSQPVNADRGFIYKPNQGNNIQYRLSVVFDNGRQYYSNIVSLRNTITASPKLKGNVANSTVSVNSPGNYQYAIYEMSGRMMSKGAIGSGLTNINTAILNRGLYIIRFTNGTAQWSEKFIRE